MASCSIIFTVFIHNSLVYDIDWGYDARKRMSRLFS